MLTKKISLVLRATAEIIYNSYSSVVVSSVKTIISQPNYENTKENIKSIIMKISWTTYNSQFCISVIRTSDPPDGRSAVIKKCVFILSVILICIKNLVTIRSHMYIRQIHIFKTNQSISSGIFALVNVFYFARFVNVLWI